MPWVCRYLCSILKPFHLFLICPLDFKKNETVANSQVPYPLKKLLLIFNPVNIQQNQNTTTARDSIINNIISAYSQAFNILWNYIAYGISKSVDFQRVENEARTMIQYVKDKNRGNYAKIKE